VAEGYAIDATEMAEKLGNERAANVVLIGALSTALDFSAAEWEKVLAEFVPKKTISVNLEAFRLGRSWIETARAAPPGVEAPPDTAAPPAVAPAPAHLPYSVRLEITPEWCKSCDICVKLCPERCLSLNAERTVELAQPEKCTGCRLCELLCPDFAIRVHLDAVRVPAAAASAGSRT
jgi:indolepyruvate ferredoxin oxidoreductase beta subunit